MVFADIAEVLNTVSAYCGLPNDWTENYLWQKVQRVSNKLEMVITWCQNVSLSPVRKLELLLSYKNFEIR